MTFTAYDPVESGCGYHVTEVGGHRPEALGDFAGDTRLTLVKGGISADFHAASSTLVRRTGACSASYRRWVAPVGAAKNSPPGRTGD